MKLESTLYYFTHHSESIIQWLFLAILLISAYVIGRAIFGKREARTDGVSQAVFADGSDIQVFLKKILDQTTKLEGVKLEGLSSRDMGEVEVQVATLKKELQSREEELGKLKAGKAGGDTDGLAVRIKELEGKLAEYEILEDDIADLSLYKEENVRLRSELDKLKSGGPMDLPQAPAAPGEDIVAEFAQAVNQEVTPAAGADLSIPATGNPMADFESAVNLEKKVQGDPSPLAAAAAPPLAAVSAAGMMPPASDPSANPPLPEGDDLFAEFANPTADQGALDTDKMMEEMAALVSLEPSKDTSLGEEIDTEKMALEATRLGKV